MGKDVAKRVCGACRCKQKHVSDARMICWCLSLPCAQRVLTSEPGACERMLASMDYGVRRLVLSGLQLAASTFELGWWVVFRCMGSFGSRACVRFPFGRHRA